MDLDTVTAVAGSSLESMPLNAASDAAQLFSFGPTGYAMLTVALFAVLWRFLRPHKNHRRSADKWWWQ